MLLALKNPTNKHRLLITKKVSEKFKNVSTKSTKNKVNQIDEDGN